GICPRAAAARGSAGVLAGEEELEKLGRGLRNEGDPRTAREVESGQPGGQIAGALAQFAIRQDLLQLAPGREEVTPRPASRGIIQPFGEGGEATDAERQRRVGRRGGRHHSPFCADADPRAAAAATAGSAGRNKATRMLLGRKCKR